jgi:hypothetical protein
LLFVVGGVDHVSPPSLNRANARKYRRSAAVTEVEEFAERSHFTLGQPGWEAVADHALTWAMENSAPAATHSARRIRPVAS